LIGGVGAAAIKMENGNNMVLKCAAPRGGIVNETGRTQVYRGFVCSIRSLVDSNTIYVTTDSSATITADGGAEATCKYSKH
jgi:hypothetical protein